MGNMVRLGMTRPGLWAGCTACFLPLLQGVVVEETSVSRDLEIAVSLCVKMMANQVSCYFRVSICPIKMASLSN